MKGVQVSDSQCRWINWLPRWIGACWSIPKVGFEDYDEDVEEVEVEKTPKRKVHGRTPTAFVPKKATDRADVGKLSLGRWDPLRWGRQSDGIPLPKVG